MMRQFTVACVVGTRPEAIKMAPIVLAARGNPMLRLQLIATGQHDALFDEAIAAFGIKPDVHLGASPGASRHELRARLLHWQDDRRSPHLYLVQGDTNTALAGAQAARRYKVPIGHVEAGLRTHNPRRPFPEEQNRVRIAKLATLHFAPAQRAADNLKRERVRGEVHVTGNPGIDALMLQAGMLPPREARAQHILITCHRRENFGAPLRRICSAIREVAAASPLPLILPVHPNPNVGDVIRTELAACANIRLTAPLSYPDMISAIRASAFVLSDSGGLQEECAALGIPLLLMRAETERQELVESGNVLLVGADSDAIVRESLGLLTHPARRAQMAQTSFPYGHGDAAAKIIAVLESWAQTHCTKTV